MTEKKQIEKDCRNVGSEKCGGPELLNSRFWEGPVSICLSVRFKRKWGIQDFENLPDQWVRRYVGMGQP